jgi:hypothetical protein
MANTANGSHHGSRCPCRAATRAPSAASSRGGRWTRIASDAPPISQGTIRSKASVGVLSSSAAPAAPPPTAATASGTSRRPCPFSSGREALTEPTPVSTSAAVLVTFAVTGGSPAASSAG